MPQSTPKSPRYTRPTISSTLKTTPRKQSLHPSSNPHTPTSPLHARKQPTSPSPLLLLPPEIRLKIYTYLLPSSWTIIAPSRHHTPPLVPPLLRICRTMRNEAAQLFYTRTEFECEVYGFDFWALEFWVRKLPREWRAWLARNDGLRVVVHMAAVGEERREGNRRIFTTNGEWQLVMRRSCHSSCAAARGAAGIRHRSGNRDGEDEGYSYYCSGRNKKWVERERVMKRVWRECQAFGNVYDIQNEQHRWHFLTFCRLAHWFLFCYHHRVRTTAINASTSVSSSCSEDYVLVPWKYYISPTSSPFASHVPFSSSLLAWFQDCVGAFMFPCVSNAWTMRVADAKREMKNEALRFVEGLDKSVREEIAMKVGWSDEVQEMWDSLVKRLMGELERW